MENKFKLNKLIKSIVNLETDLHKIAEGIDSLESSDEVYVSFSGMSLLLNSTSLIEILVDEKNEKRNELNNLYYELDGIQELLNKTYIE